MFQTLDMFKTGCKARLKTNESDTILEEHNKDRVEHNHAPESERQSQCRQVREACKRRATEQLSKPPRKMAVLEAAY